jgi:hypothetical protein
VAILLSLHLGLIVVAAFSFIPLRPGKADDSLVSLLVDQFYSLGDTVEERRGFCLEK